MPPAPSHVDRPAQRPPRIDGIDLARFAALIGMMGTHTWIFTADYSEPALVAALSGKAASLFAVLAGIGIAFTTRHALADGDDRAAALNLLGRGAALIAIGLTLGFVSPIILVILVYYGTMFWLVIPLLRVPSTALAIGAAAWMVLWPIAAFFVRNALTPGGWPASPTWLSLADPGEFARDLLLDGAYPALTWVAYPALGLALGRWLLRARDTGGRAAIARFAAALVATGSAVALAAYLLAVSLPAAAALAADLGLTAAEARELLRTFEGVDGTESLWLHAATAGHAGTPPDLLLTAGVATAVIGAGLLVGLALGPGMRRALRPLLAAGGAPLTVYTAHVIAFAPSALIGFREYYGSGEPPPWWLSSPWLWLAHIAGALLLGGLIAATRQRGPLEQVVTASGRATARLARR